MSDCDEGDAPFLGKACKICGLIDDGQTQCAECGAEWPKELELRYPYDGGPLRHSTPRKKERVDKRVVHELVQQTITDCEECPYQLEGSCLSPIYPAKGPLGTRPYDCPLLTRSILVRSELPLHEVGTFAPAPPRWEAAEGYSARTCPHCSSIVAVADLIGAMVCPNCRVEVLLPKEKKPNG